MITDVRYHEITINQLFRLRPITIWVTKRSLQLWGQSLYD